MARGVWRGGIGAAPCASSKPWSSFRPDGKLQRPFYWLQLLAFGDAAYDALSGMAVNGDDVRDRFHPSRLLS